MQNTAQQAGRTAGRRLKVLLIHDIEKHTPEGTLRWAYANRTASLRDCAPPDFDVDRCSIPEFDPSMATMYDLVFCLDYTAVVMFRYKWPLGCKTVFVVSFNKDGRSRQSEFKRTLKWADWTIINNGHRYLCDGIQPRTCHISNGVDEFWSDCGSSWLEQHPERVLWCGSTAPLKCKRYDEIILPLAGLLDREGLEHSFRPIDQIEPDLVYPPSKQREWYWSGDIAVCASKSEGGGPSYLMEAAACGCVPISTDCGNTAEWITNFGAINYSSMPTPEWFVEQIWHVRNRMAFERNKCIQAMKGHLYQGPEGRAQWFYALFRRLIQLGQDRSRNYPPFSYIDKHFSKI